ncbi:MAG: putative zinc-binding protein [Proteobacteria bacterium]|nr:putative zinc-binding protein [Pseudomonadota bacterium]
MVYACSGASDVGELTDKVARRMAKAVAKSDSGTCIAGMGCLAGIGVDLKGMIESAKSADQIIAIDGCSVSCAKKLLESKGIKTKSFNLKDLGFEKGKTPCNNDNIEKTMKLIMEKL